MMSSEEPVNNQGLRFASILADPEVEADTDAIRRLSERLSGASRLSTTFRFEAGGTNLDERSTGAIDRISRQINSGQFDGKVLLLAGFTDASGTAAANERIAQQRARNVREAILRNVTPSAARSVTLEIEGFGEISPLVCNGAPRSDYLNRRVEVWLLDN